MSEPAEGEELRGPNAEWLQSARAGSKYALGQLLEECRRYLLVVANHELPPELRGKAGASDLVQQSFLEAQESFDRFHDNGQAALRAWLRQILIHNIANLKRHYCGTDKRQLGRELPFAEGPFGEMFPEVAAPGPSPSSVAAAEERDDAIRRALAQLPDEYQRVVTWRCYERLPFEEVGLRLGRSAAAARKLWVRAVERLQELVDAAHDQ